MNTHHTPLIESPLLSQINKAPVYLKCENMQQTHSFKARGAWHAINALKNSSNGVITHSSGNHGAALSWAAKSKGIEAHIVVPENAPQSKIENIKRYGGIVHFCGAGLVAREEKMKAIQAQGNQVFIPPYNHEDIIAGQSTCAREIFSEVKNIHTLLVPVGGGGLLSGSAIAAREASPNTKVIGCEPAEADDAYRSFHSGKLEHPGNPTTMADGLRTGLGDITFGYIKSMVNDIYTVTEQDIYNAWAFVIHHLKLIIEPSCAVPFAVWKSKLNHWQGQPVAIIITGGNIDLSNLPPQEDSFNFL